MSLTTKRLTLYLGLPAAVIVGSAAVVTATVPNTFSSGEPLSSSKLNENFSSIDTRVSGLETTRTTALAADPGGTINRQVPAGWVSSITKNAAGDFTINIAPGTFTTAPICTVTGVSTNQAYGAIPFKISTDTGPSPTALRVTTSNTNFVLNDIAFNVVCVGTR